MANEKTFTAGASDDNYFESFDVDGNGLFWVGDVAGTENINGALRFENVTCNKSIQEAQLYIYVGAKDGTGNLSLRIYGIDEDNTTAFTSSDNPFSRPKTTAYYDWSLSTPSAGVYINKNITTVVQEILDREVVIIIIGLLIVPILHLLHLLILRW